MNKQKYYITLLSNWLLKEFKDQVKEYGDISKRVTNSRYFTYGSEGIDYIRISDHVQLSKNSDSINYNICITFPKNTNNIIVAIEYDTYIYTSITEVKELLKTTIRFSNIWSSTMPFSRIKRAEAKYKEARKIIETLERKLSEYKEFKKRYNAFYKKYDNIIATQAGLHTKLAIYKTMVDHTLTNPEEILKKDYIAKYKKISKKYNKLNSTYNENKIELNLLRQKIKEYNIKENS